MNWVPALPVLVAAVALLFLPGGVVAMLWGARGLTAWAMAPAFTTAIAAAGAIVLQLLGQRWSLASFLVCVAVVAVVSAGLVVVRHVRQRGSRQPVNPRPDLRRLLSPPALGVLAALAVPGVLIGYRFARMFVTPQNLSQTWDNIFHQNALRFILETGRGSSLTLGSLDPASSALSFYPGAWHDLAALLASATGVEGPVATNMLNIVIGAGVWPAGCALLAVTLFGPRTSVVVSAGVLSAALGNFPYMLVQFGVLYPNFLALALLPALLAGAIRLLGVTAGGTRHPVRDLLLTACAGVAVGLSHPSVALLFLALMAPFVVMATLRGARRIRLGPTLARWAAAVVLLALYGALIVISWSSFRPTDAASGWQPLGTPAQAWGEALASAPVQRPIPVMVAVLTVLGIVAIVARRSVPGYCLLAAHAVACGFYVVSAGFTKDDVRAAITQIWYNDSYRTAAQLAVTAVPIAAVGAAWLAHRLHRLLAPVEARAGNRPRRVLRTLAVVVGVGILVTATNSEAVRVAQRLAYQTYATGPNAPLLSPDEETVLDRLDQHVPAGEQVLGVPGNGSALAYAIGDRRSVLMTAADVPSGTEKVLFNQLQNLASDPRVCAAAKTLRVDHVLDFGTAEVNQVVHDYAGFRDLANNPGLRLVDASGPAKLYEITAC